MKLTKSGDTDIFFLQRALLLNGTILTTRVYFELMRSQESRIKIQEQKKSEIFWFKTQNLNRVSHVRRKLAENYWIQCEMERAK